MKLYTEEQVKQIFENLSVSSGYDYNMETYCDSITPIELPSDRDIEIAANGNQEHYEGAMWLKHKYLTKTNKIK